MNRNILIAIIVILLLGIGGFFVLSKKPASQSTPTNTTNVQTGSDTTPQTEQKSLKELLGMGNSQQCSFAVDNAASGTVYLSSGRMRGDFVTTAGKDSVNTHMISDGKVMNMWVDGQPYGYKMAFDEVSATPVHGSVQNSVDVNQKSNYNCSAWSADPSLFELPSNVTFKSMTELMAPAASGTGATTPDKASQCAACDSAPASYQAQCKAALGC